MYRPGPALAWPGFEWFRGRKDREFWVGPRDAQPAAEVRGLLAEARPAGLDALAVRCLE